MVWCGYVKLEWYGTVLYKIRYRNVCYGSLVFVALFLVGCGTVCMTRSGITVHVLVVQYFVVEYQMRGNTICRPL